MLQQQRRLKMARSVHAYVRGSTREFYAWLTSKIGRAAPAGPPLWICGDCHVGNLGPIANVQGEVEIEIRDLDQTVVGNPAHDLIRLAVSLATAIRGSDLPGVTTALVLEQMIVGYEQSLKGRRPQSIAAPVRVILARALKRRWRNLADERIEGVRPEIPRGARFWQLSRQEEQEIETIIESEEIRHLLTALQERDSDDRVRVVDAAYWVKGCSSLGQLRYAVLVGIGKQKHGRGSLCLVDIKEAGPAAAPRYRKAVMPSDNAQRVVEGARKLSPFLGQRMAPITFLGRPAILRELLPQDLKLEMDQLTAEDAIASARYLAGVVGRAHARQMNPPQRASWLAELQKCRSKNLDAPSWLWHSVVQLLAIHESAYLEHCRQFARP